MFFVDISRDFHTIQLSNQRNHIFPTISIIEGQYQNYICNFVKESCKSSKLALFTAKLIKLCTNI